MEMDENSYILKKSQSLQSSINSPTGVSEATDITSDTYQLVEDDEKQDERERSSVPMTSFNFINSIIGSGIIGMPFAIRQAGFGLGIFIIVLVAIVTDYSIVLLIKGGHLSNTNTYQDLVYTSFGRPGFYVLTVLQFLYPFIAMISYNVIFGDTITKIVYRIGGDYLRDTVVGNRQFIVGVCTLLITLPLSLYRNIAKLSKWGFVSFILLIFVLTVIVIRATTIAEKYVEPTPDAWNFANSNVFGAVGIVAFAYMCHHNSFLIYESMENPSQSRWNLVTHLSVLISMICMLMFGITGYATFTGYTQGDILENYCSQDTLVNVASAAFALTIALTYPIECFVTREVLENSVFANRQPQTLWRHILETVIIVVINAAISMTTSCLGIVLELNGVMAAAPLAFIIPPLCYLKLQNERILSVKNVPAILVCLFGITTFVVGLIMAFVNLSQGNTCSQSGDMDFCKVMFNETIVDHSHISTSVSPATPSGQPKTTTWSV